MNPEEILDARWKIQYRADYSARYHRRRATFLLNVDKLLTLVTLASGAGAFVSLAADAPTTAAQIGAALITLISAAQIVLQIGPAGIAHTAWLKRWSRLQASISINANPTRRDIETWTAERVAIEEECVAELRALSFDCEDTSARSFGITGRQHKIWRLQRLLIHFGTFQQTFPLIVDAAPAQESLPPE